MADTRSDQDKAKEAKKILDVMKEERQYYEEMVDNIFTFIHHGRRKIKDTTGTKGKKTGDQVYDGTALSALNLATDGISGYSFSKSYHWFNYALPGRLNFPRWSGMRQWSGRRMDEYPEVKLWLEDTEEVMYAAFLRSNFYDMGPEVVRDALSPGTAYVLAEEDVAKGRTILTVPHFRECFIAEDQFGMVDTIYRLYKLTLKQLKEKFGNDKMSKAMSNFKKSLENNPYEEKEVLHTIYPRKDYDSNSLNGANKPIASCWYMTIGKGGYSLLEETGYEISPIICWRWRKNNDELYGRSPSWDAYFDVMRSHQIAKTNLIAGHKSVSPPMIGPEDIRGKVQKAPDSWTFMPPQLMDKASPRPMVTGINMPFAIDQQERVDKIIREHYHVDFFVMLWQAAMNKVELTATQVVEMAGEKAAILGIRVGRMETEFGNPIHDVMFSIEHRAGRIPDPPQILLDIGGNIEIDYLGPLAQAQKRIFKTQSIRAGVQFVGEMSQVFPEALDNIDPDKTLKDYLEGTGFPAKDLRVPEEIKQIRQTRQAQEQAQRDVAEGVEIAKAGSRLTKTVEPGSPLDALMNPEGAA